MEQNWITSDDILGKDVIDSTGTFLGVVDKLFIANNPLEIAAISIDKGLLEKGLVVSKTYIERVSKYAVFLSITPLFLLQNKRVYTATGHYVGQVSGITQNESKKNAFDSIIVKRKSGKKEYAVDEIAQIAKSIVLK